MLTKRQPVEPGKAGPVEAGALEHDRDIEFALEPGRQIAPYLYGRQARQECERGRVRVPVYDRGLDPERSQDLGEPQLGAERVPVGRRV